ncbi:SpoIVB peptidase [Alteribacillus sp. YIM 98480]|uniref:SpoIVB peptidase n=1 Tax=Alteribacillus sp. YIM 98480 TaxID=2606599 RepID=UPI00131D0922|nr:SpoIVB peptidase [Alteribacillus sp. YIM 98480]
MDWGRRITGVALLLLFTIGITNHTVQTFLNIPDEFTFFESDWQNDNIVSGIQNKVNIRNKNDVQITENQEKSNASIKVTSMPKKQSKIKTLPDIKLVPGGDSIGVKLQSDGIMIVGFHEIAADKGRISPAKEAGMKVGDRIISINGKKVNQLEDVVQILENAKTSESLQVKVKRNNEERKLNVKMHQGKKGNVIGAYIRNAASGVGTLTFYEPKSGKFGALGHVIADSDTKKPIIVEDGTIVRSSVRSIERGANGKPGEKQAVLSTDNDILGKVTKNSSFGVFGHLDKDRLLKKPFFSKPLPIAFAHEVKKGPAEILTVVEGEKIEKFEIEIVQSVPQMHAASKGMVIKVTDDELLEKTGGIIQGMSGSPIIQDGKIIGAVTHVFVNDSTSGYASHIEWMLEEAGIETYIKERKKAS